MMFLASPGKIGAATPRPVHGPGLQMLRESDTGHVLFGFSAAIKRPCSASRPTYVPNRAMMAAA